MSSRRARAHVCVCASAKPQRGACVGVALTLTLGFMDTRKDTYAAQNKPSAKRSILASFAAGLGLVRLSFFFSSRLMGF